jgi:hypothetical protein
MKAITFLATVAMSVTFGVWQNNHIAGVFMFLMFQVIDMLLTKAMFTWFSIMDMKIDIKGVETLKKGESNGCCEGSANQQHSV